MLVKEWWSTLYHDHSMKARAESRPKSRVQKRSFGGRFLAVVIFFGFGHHGNHHVVNQNHQDRITCISLDYRPFY